MTLKQLALKRTILFVLAVVSVGVLNSLAMHHFGLVAVGMVWAAVFLIFGVRFVYQTEVDRLERENTLKKLKDIK